MSKHLNRDAWLLIEEVRRVSAPTRRDRLAVSRGIGAKIATASAGAAAATALAHPAAASAGGLLKLSLGAQFAVALVSGATFAGGALVAYDRLLSRQESPPIESAAVTHVARLAPVRQAPTTLVLPAASLPPNAPSEPGLVSRPAVDLPGAFSNTSTTAAKRGTDQTPRARSAVADRPTLTEEGLGLAQVQRALRQHDGAGALRLLVEQSDRFAHGALDEERAAARVYALCLSGQSAESRAAARDFGVRWPRSPLAVRVKATCDVASSRPVTELDTENEEAGHSSNAHGTNDR